MADAESLHPWPFNWTPAQAGGSVVDGGLEGRAASGAELGLGAGTRGGVDALGHEGGAGNVQEEAGGVVFGADPGDGHGVALELGGAGAAVLEGGEGRRSVVPEDDDGVREVT